MTKKFLEKEKQERSNYDSFSVISRYIFKFPIFGRGMKSLLKEIEKKVVLEEKLWIATVNPEFVIAANSDLKFRNMLNMTWLNVPDGVGLVWAIEWKSKKAESFCKSFWQPIEVGLRILGGDYRKTLITGVELMDQLCQMAADQGKTVYFLGGWEDRAKKTAEYFMKKYPGLSVVGYKDENFDFETKADFLFVAYGMKKQEEWIYANLKRLKVKLVMGVGRSFDYFSGELARAPESWRHRGLEWLYSLIRQPSRLKRQLRLPKFIWLVARSHPKIEFPGSDQD